MKMLAEMTTTMHAKNDLQNIDIDDYTWLVYAKDNLSSLW